MKRAEYTEERSKWLSVLNTLRTENISMKDQLALAVSRDVSRDFVEKAERFQQRFLKKDQIIDLLRHEVSMLGQHEPLTGPEVHQYGTLKKDIEQLIYEFHQMKISFARFLDTGEAD